MLKKYVRQYVGYLTDNNEVVIWINFLHKTYCNENEDKNRLSEDIITVYGGGYYFWRISVNITTKETIRYGNEWDKLMVSFNQNKDCFCRPDQIRRRRHECGVHALLPVGYRIYRSGHQCTNFGK